MTQKSLVIAGAGGLGREVYDLALTLGYQVRGFLDDTKTTLDDPTVKVRILCPVAAYVPAPEEFCIVAVGDPKGRQALAEKLTQRGASFATLIHPSAVVAPSASIAPGCILAPFVYVGPRARIGTHGILNVHASFGHDAVMGDYGAICPHGVVSGGVQVGSGVLIGSGAVITPYLTIGQNARIAAGSIVFTPMPDGAEVLGNPARARPVSL
jgi:sugar O-acyltransferase (sialic acid O-acetyltransferase NeuD family)